MAISRSSRTRRSDSRSRPRYPISLDLQFKLLRGRQVNHHGRGRTLNISSRGVLFEANEVILETHYIPDDIELVMDWPFLLQGVCAMKLIARGRIVRRDARQLAVTIERYEFRTAGRSRELPPP